jgi:hypothetical protein
MRWIVEIRKCLDCPFRRGLDECGHPDEMESVIRGKRLDGLDDIPAWCPLPAGERGRWREDDE